MSLIVTKHLTKSYKTAMPCFTHDISFPWNMGSSKTLQWEAILCLLLHSVDLNHCKPSISQPPQNRHQASGNGDVFSCPGFNCEENHHGPSPCTSPVPVRKYTDDHLSWTKPLSFKLLPTLMVKEQVRCVHVLLAYDDIWLSSSITQQGHDIKWEQYFLTWLPSVTEHL